MDTELTPVIQKFYEEAGQLPEKFISEPEPGEAIRRYPGAFDMTVVSVGEDKCSVAKCFSNNSISRIRYTDDVGDWHRHAYVELGYVYEGVYRIETKEEVLEFPEKQFCVIDPQLKHRDVFQNTAYTAIFLCMSREFFDSVFLRQLESEENHDLSGFINNALYNPGKHGYLRLKARQNLEEIENRLARMIRELQTRESGYDYLLKGYALRLIAALSSEVFHSLSAEEQKLYKTRLYQQVTEYMTEHLDSVTIDSLSKIFHFQKDYFNRLIKQFSGQSFTDQLKELRLSRAEDLLLHTRLPITDIAAMAGYQNESYFYRIFAEKNEMTPAAFRKQADNR